MSDFVASTFIVVVTVWFISWVSAQRAPWIRWILNWFPALLFAYVIPAGFTHAFHHDLSQVYLHTLSRDWIIPLAIATVMSALSFEQLKKVGVKPIALFVSGSLIIALFPFMALKFLQGFAPATYQVFVQQEYWKGLVPIVGSWIGGSTSQLVLKELAGCPNEIFLSVIVLDNFLVNLWTILMFQAIRRSEGFNRIFRIKGAEPVSQMSVEAAGAGSRRSTAVTIGCTLAVTVLTCLVTTNFLARVVFLSVAGLLLGNLIRGWNYGLVIWSGSVLIIIIMAILGLRLNFNKFLLPVSFLTLCVAWIAFHYLFLLIISKLLNLHMAWVPIASMANLGGISTAPAVTAAYNKLWMPHAILLAILSMVTGNFWGMFTLYLLEKWM